MSHSTKLGFKRRREEGESLEDVSPRFKVPRSGRELGQTSAW